VPPIYCGAANVGTRGLVPRSFAAPPKERFGVNVDFFSPRPEFDPTEKSLLIFFHTVPTTNAHDRDRSTGLQTLRDLKGRDVQTVKTRGTFSMMVVSPRARACAFFLR